MFWGVWNLDADMERDQCQYLDRKLGHKIKVVGDKQTDLACPSAVGRGGRGHCWPWHGAGRWCLRRGGGGKEHFQEGWGGAGLGPVHWGTERRGLPLVSEVLVHVTG